MPTITAQSIVDKAEIILQDLTNTRWPAEELLGWLNDGQRKVVSFKPDANPVNESVELEVGTKQQIPATGSTLIRVSRNMGTTGATPGKVVRRIDQRVLDDQISTWHTQTETAEIEHYTFDERDPKRWYAYPPSDGTGQVEIVYAGIPADIAIGDTITLDDSYSDALLDYILYRAYQKDKDYAANEQRASAAFASFMRSLGLSDRQEALNSPRTTPEQRNALVMGGGG